MDNFNSLSNPYEIVPADDGGQSYEIRCIYCSSFGNLMSIETLKHMEDCPVMVKNIKDKAIEISNKFPFKMEDMNDMVDQKSDFDLEFMKALEEGEHLNEFPTNEAEEVD